MSQGARLLLKNLLQGCRLEDSNRLLGRILQRKNQHPHFLLEDNPLLQDQLKGAFRARRRKKNLLPGFHPEGSHLLQDQMLRTGVFLVLRKSLLPNLSLDDSLHLSQMMCPRSHYPNPCHLQMRDAGLPILPIQDQVVEFCLV